MTDSSSYEIGQRVGRYINFLGMTSAQFADKALIPRASLSQLLSGRNQSVSSLLLDRLHTAFPDLNLMWVLFGQGTMRVDASVETSESSAGAKEGVSNYTPESSVENGVFGNFELKNEEALKPAPSLFEERGTEEKEPDTSRTVSDGPSKNEPFPQDSHNPTIPGPIRAPETVKDSEDINLPKALAKASRRVSRILVLYEDGTFDTYTPA